MKKLGAILGALLLFAVAGAQQSVPVYVSDTAPSGACAGPRVWNLRTNPSQTWCCIGSVWTNCTPAGGGSYTLPIASTNTLGGVKVGISHTIDGTGVLDNVLPVYARADVPTCDSTWLSKELRVHDAAQEDQTWICQLDSAGAYQWTVYSQAPSPAATTDFVQFGANLSSADGSLTSLVAGAFPCGSWDPSDFSYFRCVVGVGSTSKFTKINFQVSGNTGTVVKETHPSVDACGSANRGMAGYDVKSQSSTDWPTLTPTESVTVSGTTNTFYVHNYTGGVVAATSGAEYSTATSWTANLSYQYTGGVCAAYQYEVVSDLFGKTSGQWQLTTDDWTAKGWVTGSFMGNLPTFSPAIASSDYYWGAIVVTVNRHRAGYWTYPYTYANGYREWVAIPAAWPTAMTITVTGVEP